MTLVFVFMSDCAWPRYGIITNCYFSFTCISVASCLTVFIKYLWVATTWWGHPCYLTGVIRPWRKYCSNISIQMKPVLRSCRVAVIVTAPFRSHFTSNLPFCKGVFIPSWADLCRRLYVRCSGSIFPKNDKFAIMRMRLGNQTDFNPWLKKAPLRNYPFSL